MNEISTTQDNILSRIKKLLTLAGNNSNENEANNAFSKAQELMTKHQISMADAVSFKNEAIEPIEEVEPLFVAKRAVTWTSWLAMEICKLNGCYTYQNNIPNGPLSYVLIGRKSDCEVVRYLWNSIKTQIEALSDRYLRANSFARGEGKNASNSFKLAATKTVIERLQSARKQAVAGIESSSLVKLDKRNAEAEIWARSKIKIVSKHGVGYRPNQDAQAAGSAAGHNVSLVGGLGRGNSSGVKGFLN